MKTMVRITAVSAVLVAGVCLVAQDSVGTLVGSVKDTQGRPVAGARLLISSPALLGSRNGTTNAQGEFRLPLLPTGDYSLSVDKENFVGARATFRVSAGVTLRQDFVIREVATQEAVVEVVTSAAQVDKTATNTATSLPGEKLSELPVNRTSQGALFLSPGVSGSADRPSFRGGMQGAAQFYVNGISVKDGNQRYGRQTPYVITDLTEEVQVSQSPLNAKYGNSSGGRVDLTSKSGTNEFQGSFRVTPSRESWSSYSAPVIGPRTGTGSNPLTGDSIGTDDLQKDYQVTILGPIIPGVLTFSYGRTWSPTALVSNTMVNQWDANRRQYVNNITGTATTTNSLAYTFGTTSTNPVRSIYRQGNKDVVNQFKLFWIVNPDHQLEAFYSSNTYGPNLDGGVGSNNANQLDESAAMVQSSLRQFYGVNYRGVFGQGVLDVQVGRTIKRINFSSGPEDPLYVRYWATNAGSIATHYTRSTQYVTEGDPSYPWRNVRQNDQFKANYTWANGIHTVDAGVEWLEEIYKATSAQGPNGRAFFTPGLRLSGTGSREFQVFNFFGSALDNTAFANYLPIVANGSGYIPEMRIWETSGGDFTNRDGSASVYVNDLWTLNQHWSLMGGLRFDKWTVKNRLGTAIDTQDISPRFEAKFDLFGDSRHLFNSSLAVFRGTIGAGMFRATYGRQGGNILNRYFWNQGSATAFAWVPRATFKDPVNYRLYQVIDADLGHEVDPNLKPEKNTQLEVGYRRSFQKGGFFRVTGSYSRFDDLLYLHGYNEVVTLPTPGKTPYVPSSQIRQRVEHDPYNKRSSRSLEMEFDLPVYRSDTQSLSMSGFWTSVRARGRATWNENLTTTVARFYPEMEANGYGLDAINSYGEYASSLHNRFTAWMTWKVGNPKGLQSSITLKGDYLSGEPYSLTLNKTIDLTVFTPAYVLPGPPPSNVYASETPSNAGQFLNHRGAFTHPDTFAVDLKWNLDIPLAWKARLFTELSVFNIFNHLVPTGYRHEVDPANYPAGVTTFRQNPSQWARANYPTTGSGNQYGDPFMGRRSFGLSCGIRF